ncbi:MAG: hypothetical protein K2H61_00885 [Muribaculaceae bacterium]|nr:hypothetical protein [Muribaculaceae bacterium]
MNPEFLIPFICLCISASWMFCVKKAAECAYEDVSLYYTPLWSFIILIFYLSIIIGIVIAGINAGFLIALAYIGVLIVTSFINQLIVAYITISIFGFQGLGAIAPVTAGIVSAIWMFSKSGTF